jgi:protein TonB
MILFGLVVATVIISCNSSTDSETDNNPVGTDSSMMTKDNTTTQTTTPDTNATIMTAPSADTVMASKTGMAKPDPSKKGKKGKVSVEMTSAGTGEMTPDKEGYYSNAEILPAYPGGQKALENFFSKNIEYPMEASDNGVEGTVKINFAVDENGKIYAPKLISEKIGYGLEQEALRAFNKMPKWTPGRIKGKNVKTRFTLPVTFLLSE